jgi:hypothetical protein
MSEATNEAGERFNSVSSKYLSNLNDLLVTLHQSKLHYIRCFNPNEKRSPGVFEKKYVLEQVIQCGTVELVKLMHDGFPHRCKLEDIRKRFTKLLPEDFKRYKDRDFVEAIMIAFELPEKEWTVGTSRLFLKAGQLRVLENLLDSGSVASQDMIMRIVRQFARKKFRAARNAIRFAIWLPRYARSLRRATVRRQLQKACRIYVGLSRWLRRSRRVLYGASPPRDMALVKWRLQQAGVLFPLSGQARLQAATPAKPQLFVALNHYEILDYKTIMDTQVTDIGLTEWQRKATESVLYFDNGFIRTTELSPAKIIPSANGHISDAPGLSHELYVDVAGSGFAVQSPTELTGAKIKCMCQHGKDTQVFATYDGDCIMTWSWNGTDICGNSSKRAIAVDSCFMTDAKEIMYGMCFLSTVPECVSDLDSHMLLTLTGRPNRPWLTITVLSVSQPDVCRVEFQLNIGQDGSLLEAARSGQLLFQISNSEKVLVVAGKSVVLFFEIRIAPKISVELIKDLTKEFRKAEEDEYGFAIVSCLCMPPTSLIPNTLDWIVLGDDGGALFGFLWIANSTTGRVTLAPEKYYGRFSNKQARHSDGVPVGLVTGTYGDAWNTHHKSIKAKAAPIYWDHLQKADCEQDRFFSVGDDGKLLRWRLFKPGGANGNGGWLPKEEQFVNCCLEKGRPSYTPGEQQILAAHSSRLVPNLLLLVDRGRRISCVDTSKDSSFRAGLYGGC